MQQKLHEKLLKITLYQGGTQELKKYFNIPVFLHHINVRKRVKIIPHLRERKIVKQW